MSTTVYTSANTDELEALGDDHIPFDTSAGIGPEDNIDTATTSIKPPIHMAPSRRFCFIFSIIVLILVLASALIAFFVSNRNKNNDLPSTVSSNPHSPQPASTNNQTLSNSAINTPKPTTNTPLKKYSIEVINKYPHDKTAFTQGFEFSNGVFYESTGLRGHSSLRKVDISTGKVLQHYEFPDMMLFGEGITLHTTHHIFMLTWQAGRGLIFNQSTFELMKEWKYEGEGWGLTMDRKADEVYMSDGTNELRILDPEDLSEKRRIQVTSGTTKVDKLNELEWVCGEIWANIWTSKTIVRIDPKTGNVNSVIDASILPLADDQHNNINVLNGIAFDKSKGRLWLTGKNWPTVYEVAVKDDSLDLSSC